MIAWMLYAIVVSTIVAAGAWIADVSVRVARWRRRWVWTGALALSVGVPVAAALRRGPADDLRMGWPATHGEATRSATSASSPAAFTVIRGALNAPVEAALAETRRVPGNLVAGAAALAAMLSGAVLSVLLATATRLRAARRDWTRDTLHGVPVRVARDVGPLVVGLFRPEVVVPRWLLDRPDEEQRLVVAHEMEHIRSHDPALLALGWVAAVAMPWNPAIWSMLSRLRLAIEIDCDARMLAGGQAAGRYGSLLIDVAQRASPIGLGVLTLIGGGRHLRQRIFAIGPRLSALARTRGLAGLAAAGAVVTVACQIPRPSSTGISEPVRLPAFAQQSPQPDSTELPKHKPVTPGLRPHERDRHPPEATLPIGAHDALDQVSLGAAPALRLLRYDSVAPAPFEPGDDITATRHLAQELAIEIATGSMRNPTRNADSTAAAWRAEGFEGPVIINGAYATTSRMRALRREDVQRFAYLNGNAAPQYFRVPEAYKGVIAFETKPGARQP